MSGTFIDTKGRVCENLGAGSRYCEQCGGTHVIFNTALDWSGAKDGLLMASDAHRVLVCPSIEVEK